MRNVVILGIGQTVIDELWDKIIEVEKANFHSTINCPQDETLQEIKKFIYSKIILILVNRKTLLEKTIYHG